MQEMDDIYMQRSLELARKGIGRVSTNPMVGSVIVFQDKIIGEGYHQKYGEAHAEVNAIESVVDKNVLSESTLYVNLEPCAHFGKTPPCADLIIKHRIPRVVIGSVDTFSKVAGKGIERMLNSGIDVKVGVLEEKCRFLNRRFFTFHEKKRPYIILKWARSADGFLDVERIENSEIKPTWISGETSRQLVHQWRSQEDAIMVGTNTVLKDNPKLNVRSWVGKHPVRVSFDYNQRIPETANILDQSIKTIIYTNRTIPQNSSNVEYVNLRTNSLADILTDLYQRNIQSVLVEGGKKLFHSFLEEKIWDEAREFIGETCFYNGVSAPIISDRKYNEEKLAEDIIRIYYNR